MATATHAVFGYTGSLSSTIPARSRREPKYSKQKQTRMICAILSRRMMSPKKTKSLKGKSIPKPLEELLKEARKHKTATGFKKWWQTQAEDPFSYWRSARISKALSDAKLVKGGFPDYKAIFELAKKQPDTKLSQRGEWLLSGKYKIQGKPKEVQKLGKAVTKGVKKTKKVTEKPKVKAKPKKKKKVKAKSPQRTLFGGL